MCYTLAMEVQQFVEEDFKKLWEQPKDSHKAEGGRVLVIGGSELFHASIFWSADIASRFVDLVHFASPTNENNELVRLKLKEKFWDGIVIDWSKIDLYVEEDDVILIGPGMPRMEGLMEGEEATDKVVNRLLKQFPDKKWVVDGGALQECDVELLSPSCVITPHIGEMKRLLGKIEESKFKYVNQNIKIGRFEELLNGGNLEEIAEFVRQVGELFGGTVLLKGVNQKDLVCTQESCVVVGGGNEGLTKGGTGDVLAGLVVSFYVHNEAARAACAASYLLKKAADELYQEFGKNYKTSELVLQIPKTLRSMSVRNFVS